MTIALPAERVDYLAIGHVTADVQPDGTTVLGGAVSYAGRTAAALGWRAGVVTRAAPGFPLAESLPGVDVHSIASPTTTTFVNRYRDGARVQTLKALAPPLDSQDIPPAWRRVRVLHLAPVAGELSPTVASDVRAEFVGATAQGWLRAAEVGSLVRPVPWQLATLGGVDAVVVSEEDLAGEMRGTRWLTQQVPLLVVTRGREGADAYCRGEVIDQPAYQALEVDPTGAGDVFAAALFVRLVETGDLAAALPFAAAAAAFVVEARGLEGIAPRRAVEERMRTGRPYPATKR